MSSDDPKPLLPEGDYTCTLREVEGRTSHIRPMPYLSLLLTIKEGERKNERLFSSVFGGWENIIAWRTLIGRDFIVRVRHKSRPTDDCLLLDNRIRELKEDY